jgi:hypothetical protein
MAIASCFRPCTTDTAFYFSQEQLHRNWRQPKHQALHKNKLRYGGEVAVNCSGVEPEPAAKLSDRHAEGRVAWGDQPAEPSPRRTKPSSPVRAQHGLYTTNNAVYGCRKSTVASDSSRLGNKFTDSFNLHRYHQTGLTTAVERHRVNDWI